jgi:hypothetical protein
MKNLEKQAMGIVAQLFDLAEVTVKKRQEINDVAYDYVTEQLIITDVSHQRELLLSYEEWLNEYDKLEDREKQVDKYLAK